MTVRQAMTFGAAELTDADALIEDNAIVLEQKFDGTRCMIVVTTAMENTDPVIQFLARNGQPLKHTAAKQHFEPIREALTVEFRKKRGEIVLDGEIMIDTGMFIAFDMPYLWFGDNTDYVTPDKPFSYRSQTLKAALRFVKGPIVAATTHWGAEAKRKLLDDVIAAGGEGVMAKRLDSPYSQGKRVKHSLKIKLVKTADVVLISTSDEPKSGEMAIVVRTADMTDIEQGSQPMFQRAPGEPVYIVQPMGRVTMIGKPGKVGDVVEVNYLYVGAGGALYQPRIMQVREDREPESCTLEQFTTYSKAVL